MGRQEYYEDDVEEDEEEDYDDDDEYEDDDEEYEEKTSRIKKSKELGLSCMLNTEVGAVLAVIRRRSDSTSQYYYQDDVIDSTILNSLKSLRSIIFNPRQSWKSIDPSIYLSPFLDVISSDDVPAGATAVALSSVLKIMKLNMFDKKTPGAREAVTNIVMAVTGCRLEKTHPVTEAAVMMRILQVLAAVMRHSASVMLNDHTVCTIVNTCFQVVQQSAMQGDLLQRTARHTMHDLVQIIFSRLSEIEVGEWENSESDTEDSNEETGYGIRCAVDIFHFLCSLLNVVGIVETDGSPALTADEDVQVFALVLINSALELSGDSSGKHKKLLRMVQDDIFHHLIHYGTSSSPLVLSMICSTVLNIYYFHRESIRLQLEAFFIFVLFKTLNQGYLIQLQELALEGIINFCRQPTFLIEVYINYDCDPILYNVFEEIGKSLCKHAFLSGVSAPTSLQLQAFEGLMVLIHNIADNVDKQNDLSPTGPYPVEITEYKPFWKEVPRTGTDFEIWIESVRLRKAQKRKMMIAGSHFNRDDKKGLDYLKISKLISDPPDPKGHAMFLRYTPWLDKTKIGEFLGDPGEFNLKVLKEFTNTFELSGLVLDTALRTYLETFRLPGESQKIHRILEAFSERFYEQQSSEIFVTKDAVFILCYSVIMLNTDQHNPQVKKKMTEDEFIRNNRAINNGQDLPREYLVDLFTSIATKAITIFGQTGSVAEMNPSGWIQLINKSKQIQPYVKCDFDRRIGRDMFASIAGPTVATLSAIFEHTEDEEVIHECIDGLFAVARICQYGLQDALDELLSSFCKFTTLLNPYASAEETLFSFGHDLKPRMATLAVFTVANNFKDSIRAGWRSIIDCLLKLKRLKLLPQSIVEVSGSGSGSGVTHTRTESESLNDHGRINTSNLMAVISHCLSMENLEESLNLGITEFEQNLKVIQQCKIGSIFSKSSTLPLEPLLNLGRSLIFAAAGKGQKFNTPLEEEETVQFCWDLIQAMASCNVHRIQSFWPTYNDYLLNVIQHQLAAAIPFAEKAIIALIRICIKLLASKSNEKLSEELLFKSINLMWKLDGKVLDICNEFILKSVTKILKKYSANLLSQLGWKTVLHLLSSIGRSADTYERRADALINLMSQGTGISITNYAYCIDCAFRFVALRNSHVDKNMRLMDLMADSVKLIVEWFKNGYSDPGSSSSMNSTTSFFDDNLTISMNLFVKLGEVLRKTSLARREEVRNYAVTSLQKTFMNAEDLHFIPTNIITCFNLVIFAMVDDLHEKMLEYSTRENAERETRSMEGTLKLSMEVLVDVYLRFLKVLIESPGFKTFWLGILRRMDTCMKADLGPYGESMMKEVVPDLLTKMITNMQEKEVLVPQEGNDLWEITYVQIQWIAPSLKESLFPDAAD